MLGMKKQMRYLRNFKIMPVTLWRELEVIMLVILSHLQVLILGQAIIIFL